MRSIKATAKKYMSDIIGNSAYDISKFFLLLIITQTIPTGMLVTIKSFITSNFFVLIFISAILFSLTIFAFLIIYSHVRKYKYRIISADIKLEYNKEKIIVTSTLKVQPKRRGLDRIYNRYTWFSDEKSSVHCLTKGYNIQRLPRRDTSYEYDVCFNKKVKKGKPLTYMVRVINENLKGHFNDFYSREIIAPMDFLKITLVIPSKYNVHKIYTEEIVGSFRNDASTKNTIDFMVSYDWEIPNPKIGMEYKISW